MQTMRVQRYGRSNGAAGFDSTVPMELDSIRHVAPSVFAETRHSSRSERYSYIPTVAVLERLQRDGFGVFSVKQGGSRDEEKRGFTKHMLRLRHRDSAPM